eukprot:6213704-Pleurochrysis_carterae.AAC.1
MHAGQMLHFSVHKYTYYDVIAAKGASMSANLNRVRVNKRKASAGLPERCTPRNPLLDVVTLKIYRNPKHLFNRSKPNPNPQSHKKTTHHLCMQFFMQITQHQIFFWGHVLVATFGVELGPKVIANSVVVCIVRSTAKGSLYPSTVTVFRSMNTMLGWNCGGRTLGTPLTRIRLGTCPNLQTRNAMARKMEVHMLCRIIVVYISSQ